MTGVDGADGEGGVGGAAVAAFGCAGCAWTGCAALGCSRTGCAALGFAGAGASAPRWGLETVRAITTAPTATMASAAPNQKRRLARSALTREPDPEPNVVGAACTGNRVAATAGPLTEWPSIAETRSTTTAA
jgi:hypothetical protein